MIFRLRGLLGLLGRGRVATVTPGERASDALVECRLVLAKTVLGGV